MSQSHGGINRRQLLGGTVAAAMVAGGVFKVAQATSPGTTDYSGGFPTFDRYAEQYMREMSAPAMTLVMADRSGTQRVAAYGFADLEGHVALEPDELFHIGSISKSFVALALLQMRDEGKLDLHRPVVEYLPWLRISSRFAPITAHHLMSHGAGLPSMSPVFFPDPKARHLAAYAPGENFHYSNLGWSVLGHLAWTLDGRELPELLRQRILEPLGMKQTEPVITLEARSRMAKSYHVFRGDLPEIRGARVSEAPGIIMTEGAGCVASTAADMGAYLRMILNEGEGPGGRIVSKEAFALFATPHLKAAEFGPTAYYGYGIVVDQLDGHKVLRHTGGMVSYMSSILMDVDAGVGAFASINAMLGYRPVLVTQFAARLMRACRDDTTLPGVPEPNPATRVDAAADYAGTYRNPDGRSMVFTAEGRSLYLLHQGQRLALRPMTEPEQFVVPHADFEPFALQFTRRDPKDPKSPVTEVGWGSDWYAGSAYVGPRMFNHRREWDAYVGHYRNESPWTGSARIVLRKGQLWIDGTIPLEHKGDRFYLRDEDHSPEWLMFGEIVNGRCMRISLSGEERWRVAAT